MGSKDHLNSGFWGDPSGSGDEGGSTGFYAPVPKKPILRTRDKVAVWAIAGGLAALIIFAIRYTIF